ncbi:9-cis-epoxycarotenoid dioxygenase NCED6, chloroplastic-like protein, partial [Tanacetum coccineum]
MGVLGPPGTPPGSVPVGGEPCFVPVRNGEKEDEGYIMSYARDEDKDRSELIIVDALSMKQTSITLVLRMLVEGNQPLQEKRQQAIESI